MNIRFYNAKILIPAEGTRFNVIEGELWVRGDTICYIGDGSDVSCVCEENDIILWDREINVCGNLLMPGFKNAHTHTAMTFLRSAADDLPLQEWLNRHVFPKEAKLLQEDIYWLSVLGIMEYLTSGITSCFDMYFKAQAVARAAADVGFRSVHTGGFNDFTESAAQMEEDYHAINEMGSLTSYMVGFHAEYTTSLKHMKSVAVLAEKLHSPVWFHNAETRQEVEECKGRYGKTPTQIADELGMYAHGGGGYHCIWLEDKDIEIFRERNLYAVTNPASNLKLASGICPTKRLFTAGIPMAIGTDGPASNNCLDMFREMFLVSALAKIREMDAECIAADEILYMAVTGGARAMGLLDCDCLAVGKRADIIMIDLKLPNMQPENNIVKNLVYSGSKQNVKLTMVNGKILYEDQIFYIGYTSEEIYRKANAITARLND